MNITAFTCVKNEINYIEAWFENMKQADHILIQDGGSTDGTIEILMKLKDKHQNVTLLLQNENWDKYKWNEERVRNQCLGLFKTEWIIYSDADELIEDKFWEWARTDHGNKIAYFIPHKNLWLQRDQFNLKPPWFPDASIRFFKNHSGLFWVGKEHSSLWHMSGMLTPENELCGVVPEDMALVHYHRAEEGYYNAVMEDKIQIHSNEKEKISQSPILARLRQHPTGAGLIRRRFE